MLLVDRNGITIEVNDPDSVMLTIFKLIRCAVRKPAPGKICVSNLEYQPTADSFFSTLWKSFPRHRDNVCWKDLFEEAIVVTGPGVQYHKPG